MRVLVVGSGGREHALAWKLAQSRRVQQVFVAPGNGGTSAIAENIPISADDIPGLVEFAQTAGIGLTVIGPEAPLVAGLVDAFQAAGLSAFGPTAAAARLEGSKAFAKQFMVEEGIPTAPAVAFEDCHAARAYLSRHALPVVIKADGLAAGKGVIVCQNRSEAEAALTQIMVERAFGDAGKQVLIEDYLEGEEASLLAFCDGTHIVPMLPARDYKRALDHDQGPNTGGMGGYAPSTSLTPPNVIEVTQRVLEPAMVGMLRRGTPYVGLLYAGLIKTANGIRVLEFNCRFGDPETQILLPLLDTDLADLMLACIEGRLANLSLRWKPGFSVGVVLASSGYPGPYAKGKAITGLDQASQAATAVFHASTAQRDDEILTAGGRVLAVTAVAEDLESARRQAYAAAGQIAFDGVTYRSDIAVVPPSASALYQPIPASSAYAAAGVSIDAGDRAVALMKEAVQRTYTPHVLGGIGAFGGSIAIQHLCQQHDLALVATTDGVGTKTMIAEAMGVYDTVGHDIVNHCVNDILVQGAHPLIFLDYIAAARLDPARVARVVEGCAEACQAVGCVLIGGETAEMPGVYHSGSFDLVGTMIGWVDRRELVTGDRVEPGDLCIGLASSGLHTNGFTLARRAFTDVPWDTMLPELGRPIGEVLLTPHRAYLAEVETLWSAGVTIQAMAHLTGGAFIENIPRVLPQNVGVRIDCSTWSVPPVFQLIRDRAHVDPTEMYRVFNMGIGMVLIIRPDEAARVLTALPEARVIGEATSWDGCAPRVILQNPDQGGKRHE